MTALRMLAWELVARQRWLFWPWVAFLALISLVCGLLPPALRDEGLGVSLAVLLIGPALGILVGLTPGFDGRLEDRASIFPVRLFTLPVSSLALAGVPLLLGTLVIMTAWLLCATCVLRPCGTVVPLVWPALGWAVVLAWCQALAWSPFRLPWLRLVVMGVATLVLVFALVLLQKVDVSQDEARMTVGLTVLLLGAYGVAVRGVERARHGAGRGEPARQEAVGLGVSAGPVRPFSSALRAQLWLEWRLNRWGILFLTVLNLVWTVALTQLNLMALRIFLAAEDQAPWPWLMEASEQVGLGWLCVPSLALAPLILGLSLGVDMGRMTPHAYRLTLPPSFATLPLDTARLARGKVIFAAPVMLASWMLAACTALVWAALTGQFGDMADHLVAVTGSPRSALALLAAGFLLAVVVSWSWLLRDLWAALAGWFFLMWLPPALRVATYLAGLFCVKWWFARPEVRPLLLGLVLMALALKVAAAVWVVWRTRRQGLLRDRLLAGAVIGWMALATLSAGLVCWLADGPAALFGGVVLLVPLARPLALPLALARNRHR